MKRLFPLYMLLTVFASAGWTPPAKPDPSKILEEAEDDTDARRYEDALAKFEWYHTHAVSIQPSQVGVRLSFGLSSWSDLAAVYPPALESLKKFRDEAQSNVKGEAPRKDAFTEVARINRRLKADAATADLFIWLDANRPEEAKRAYRDAQEALIETRNYKLCGRYLDPEVSYKTLLEHLSRKETGSEYRQRSFTRDAARLVALLSINDRQTEAERYAEKAATAFPDPGFAKMLERAKKGIMP